MASKNSKEFRRCGGMNILSKDGKKKGKAGNAKPDEKKKR